MDARGEEDYRRPPRLASVRTGLRRREKIRCPGRHPHMNIPETRSSSRRSAAISPSRSRTTHKDGRGVYREPVDDPNQTLDDADIAYSMVGGLILLKIKPFREEETRYLIYNTQDVSTCSAPTRSGNRVPRTCPRITASFFPQARRVLLCNPAATRCSTRTSPRAASSNVRFRRRTEKTCCSCSTGTRKKANTQLLPYNLIKKEVQTPIRCQGLQLVPPTARMPIFRAAPAAGADARVHPVQSLANAVHHARSLRPRLPTDGSYSSPRSSNADLVAGISEALTVERSSPTLDPRRRAAASRM